MFSIHDARSLANNRIVSVYGDYQYNFKIAFKRCVLEVTFYVHGLDLTYANIWQTSFTDLYLKQWLRRFPKERFVCKYDSELACDWMILIVFALTTRHSL